jgi:hypothetical protein
MRRQAPGVRLSAFGICPRLLTEPNCTPRHKTHHSAARVDGTSGSRAPEYGRRQPDAVITLVIYGAITNMDKVET